MVQRIKHAPAPVYPTRPEDAGRRWQFDGKFAIFRGEATYRRNAMLQELQTPLAELKQNILDTWRRL
ncbi:MAG: hypothetical protein ACLFUM_08670 [Spirochaetaceae bacterium]